jgi:hypothetical protein
LSHFYTKQIDFNRPAMRLAREVGLPLLGTSDSHLPRQFGTTDSLIEGELTVTSALAAIRKGRMRVVSRPLTVLECAGIGMALVGRDYRERARKTLRGQPAPLQMDPRRVQLS